MASDAARYVVCYDVTDDKRRTRLSNCLDSYGNRVQYSVFEAVLDCVLFDNLIEDAKQIIDPQQDQVAVFPLCAARPKRAQRLGKATPVAGEEIVFIV